MSKGFQVLPEKTAVSNPIKAMMIQTQQRANDQK